MEAFCPTCKIERSIPFAPSDAEKHCPDCGTWLTKRPRAAKPLERRTELKPKARPARPKPISPASPAQRAKIAAHPFCVACEVERSEWVTIDSAHLTPRGSAAGGCDDEACVLGLCRTLTGGCHRLFDDGKLDLLAILADRHPAYLPELQHMLVHQTPVEMVQRLANDRVEWASQRRAAA